MLKRLSIKFRGIALKSLYSLLMMLFLCSCAENQFSKDLLPFELRLAEREPGPNLKEMIFYKSDQTFYVYDSVYLKNIDVSSTEIIDWQTQPKIKVTLTEKGRQN